MGRCSRKYTSGSRAQSICPSIWDAGSSVSHLDESSTLETNGLMTPFIDRGEAIHDPGKLTFSILGDLGWINTRIVHSPADDTEAKSLKLNFSIEVKSDTSITGITLV